MNNLLIQVPPYLYQLAVSILDRNCFANFDEPRQQLAIQPGGTSLTRDKTWKSSVNLPRSNFEMVCTTELNNTAISVFLKSIAPQISSSAGEDGICAIRSWNQKSGLEPGQEVHVSTVQDRH